MTQRILFVNHTGELGGAEMTLLPIAERYREHCVVALLKDGPLRGRLNDLGVEVVSIPSGSGMLGVSRTGGAIRSLAAVPAVAATAWRLARLARGFDVLYANSQKAAVVTLIAGRLIGKPVVWYLHDIMSAEHFSRMQRRAAVTLANWGAQSVICNSTASKTAFVDAGGNAARVSIAPSGVDNRIFDAVSAADTLNVRTELGIGDAPLVGLFSRLAFWKGQHVLVEALASLADVHAAIVGDALFDEQPYQREVMVRAQALGVADRIHWLGFRDDIPRLMRACDVVAHTSISPEPFGRVIVEAMMARRPLIASEHGASVELLGEGYPYLLAPADPAGLAEAIRQILGKPATELERLTDANYARACAQFSTRTMFHQIDRALAA
jgi:glycosyltransferase involved in cell wall biosynthesis